MIAEQPELGNADISSEEAFRAIRESCLIPCLELELAQASFIDMGNRHAHPIITPHPLLDINCETHKVLRKPAMADCTCFNPLRHSCKRN